jgi:DNA-directed RNA polymerase specialized sigma24 family protein
MGLALGRTAGTVTRRLRRLMRHLRDPLVVAVTDPLCTLPAEHRQITIEYFLHELSIPKIAQIHQLTRFEVREMLEYVRGWHRGVSKEARIRNQKVMS